MSDVVRGIKIVTHQGEVREIRPPLSLCIEYRFHQSPPNIFGNVDSNGLLAAIQERKAFIAGIDAGAPPGPNRFKTHIHTADIKDVLEIETI